MKRSKLSENQIISILKAVEGGTHGARSLSLKRDRRGDLLQMEAEVRRNASFRHQAVA